MKDDDRLDERGAALVKQVALVMEMDQIPASAEDFRSRLLASVERDQDVLLERANGKNRRDGLAHGYRLEAQAARELQRHQAAILAILRDAEVVVDEVQRARTLKRLKACGDALQVGPGQRLGRMYPHYVDELRRLAGTGPSEAQS